MLLILFALIFFEVGSCFMPGPDLTAVLLFVSPTKVGWNVCTITPSHSSIWGLMKFLPRLALNCYPLISTSQVARIVGLSHWAWLQWLF
jgi:hypothetical protein